MVAKTKRRVTMKVTVKVVNPFERLAEIKSIIKPLEVEASNLMKEIIEKGAMPKKVVTEFGNMCYGHRETWEVTDKPKLIKTMTPKLFMEGATITNAQIAKLCGKVMIDKLVKNMSINLKSDSPYYSLRKK